MRLKFIISAVVSVVLIAAAVLGIYHIPRTTEITLPAMLVNEDQSEIVVTELTLSGKMTHNLFGEQRMVFDGNVKINAKPFSDKPGTYHQTIYFLRTENDFGMLGHGVYFAPDTASSTLYTNKDLSKMVMKILGWDGDKSYYVIAPASSWQEVDGICEDVGLVNPFAD